MPRLNKTGPLGAGPASGRGLGPCGDGSRGFFRRGLGFGRRWTKADESAALDEEEKILKEELAEVQEAKKAFKN